MDFTYIMIIEKGKTSNGYAKKRLFSKIALHWRGGYFTFMVNVIKNTTTKNIILSMYFAITTTSFPDSVNRNKVA